MQPCRRDFRKQRLPDKVLSQLFGRPVCHYCGFSAICEVSLKIDQRDRNALVLLSRIYLNSGEKEKAKELLLKIENRDEEISVMIWKELIPRGKEPYSIGEFSVPISD